MVVDARPRAALLTPPLVFFSGGCGWFTFLKEAAQGEGVFGLLGSLQHDYTIGPMGYRWGNAVITLFVPQRGILLGVALAVIVWTLWLEASSGESEPTSSQADAGAGAQSKAKLAKNSARHQAMLPANLSLPIQLDSFAFCLTPFAFSLMLAAGLVAGLLPLAHAHSFVVTMAIGGCLALWQMWFALARKRRTEHDVSREAVAPQANLTAIWLPWAAFFAAAFAVGAPQMLWAMRGSAVQTGTFFAWHFGWDHGTENIIWFWLKNTGFFIPLLAAALVWRRPERLVSARVLYFYLPFALCFILPNLFKLSPWVWDNIKVLIFGGSPRPRSSRLC
ncbi:MAG: hypothetical protein WKF30_11045 [Pyrinomonadaceae bacterium]